MKETRHSHQTRLLIGFSISVILGFGLSGCSTPSEATTSTDISPAAPEGSSSPALPTDEVINTPTPSSTPTETPAATVQVEQLHFDLPEATLDNLTELPAVVREQTFPLPTTTRPDGSISRPFRCVSDGLSVGRIQLTENIFSLVSAECWYEVNGERRVIYVPLMFSDGNDRVVVRTEIGHYDPRMEEFGNEVFWDSVLREVGYTGDGHVFVINADPIDPSLGVHGTFQGLGADELSEKFNDLYEEFGESGDADVLGGVLSSWNIGFAEGLNN